MGKGKFPEVRSMIEFDRLAKHHIMDAYSQLVPSLKRIIRQLSIPENQVIIQQQVHSSAFREADISSINSSAAEKSALSLSANRVKAPSVSGGLPTLSEPPLKQWGTK